MGFDQIIPALFLILVLILILPSFLRTNSQSKQFFKNIFIWSIIVLPIVLVVYFISK